MTDAPLPAPRLGSRDLFPALAARSYLNHAGVSPPSAAVAGAARALLDAYARGGAAAVAESLALRRRLRERIAALLGGSPADVALTGGASHGILAVALSFPWRAGDRVVLLDGEFPANVTPWLRAAALFALEPVFLPASDFAGDAARGLERLEAEVARGARVVAVSAVQFQTGLAMPLREMAAVCARRGAQVCVDGIQAAGVTPLDPAALGVDYVACGAHKWLMGLEGSGFLWIRPGRAAELRPALAGWLSHEDPVSFLADGREGLLRYDRPLRRDASVFEGSSAASIAQAGLDASLATLLALGVPAIRAHVDAFLDLLEPGLRARGFEVLRPAEPARRAGILAARAPAGVHPAELRRRLEAAGVAIAIPDGLARFAPHWPNALDEVPLVLDAIDRAVHGG